MNLFTYVGIVEGQALNVLLAEDGTKGPRRLSAVASSVAGPDPDSIDIGESDGLVLLVRGIARETWIYSAVIVERASELQSIIAQAALGRPPKFPSG